MSVNTKSKLEESWVANDIDEDEGRISWAESSDESDLDIRPSETKLQTPPRLRKASKQQSAQTPVTSSYREPEFVMPSIERPSVALKRPGSRVSSQPRIYDRERRYESRTVGATATPSRSKRPQPTSGKAKDIAYGTGEYVLDIIASTLKTLKKPISWVLAAYLFGGLLVLVQNLLTSSITSALTPICRIPGVSLLNIPICRSPYTSLDHPTISSSSTSPPTDPEFDSLMTIQGKFENVLDDSIAGISLPLDMKRSEVSIRDLRQVVRFSSIASRNELVNEFDGFIETARTASYDLQKFNSHVGRAVDSVLSTARWTQRVLDDISYQTSTTSSSGMIADFINNRLLAPFQPLKFTESRLLEQYITHTRLISGEIESLIDEAQALLLVLNNLEDRLDIIHAVSLRDNIAAKSSRDEILSQLWTYVGGNRAKLGKVDNQLKLLARVSQYRKLAYAHVSGTILKLQAMGAELEELRTRVGGAELVADRGISGVPLSVHLESIRLGVERLEGQREKARELEKGHVRKTIEKANPPDEERRLLVEG